MFYVRQLGKQKGNLRSLINIFTIDSRHSRSSCSEGVGERTGWRSTSAGSVSAYMEAHHAASSSSTSVNMNGPEYCDAIRAHVEDNLRKLQGAPSVQMQEIPQDFLIQQADDD